MITIVFNRISLCVIAALLSFQLNSSFAQEAVPEKPATEPEATSAEKTPAEEKPAAEATATPEKKEKMADSCGQTR